MIPLAKFVQASGRRADELIEHDFSVFSRVSNRATFSWHSTGSGVFGMLHPIGVSLDSTGSKFLACIFPLWIPTLLFSIWPALRIGKWFRRRIRHGGLHVPPVLRTSGAG